MRSYLDGIRYDATDSKGYRPDMKLIGRNFMHHSGGLYVVGGYSWDADRMRWMIGYKQHDSPVVMMRLPENFFAMVNGVPRFVAVQ